MSDCINVKEYAAYMKAAKERERITQPSGLGADYASTHEEMREQIEASQRVKDAERAVIDAALNYREAVRESTRCAGAADEFVHQYFDGWHGELNACLLAAIDNLVTARDASPHSVKE